MTGLPEPRAILGPGRPIEGASAEVLGDRAEQLGLLGDSGLGAVELHEKHRDLGEGQARMKVAGFDLQGVEQLDPGHRDPRLDREDRGVAGRFDAREGTDAGRDGLRDAG